MGFILNIILISGTGDIGIISNQYADKSSCVAASKLFNDDFGDKSKVNTGARVKLLSWYCTPVSVPTVVEVTK
jgi:hypothetical protein